MIQPRLSASELRQVRRAGMFVPGQRRSIFGSMFSWFPSVRFGRPTFWPTGANAKPPVNAAESSSGQIVTPATALTISAFWACVWLNSRVLASLPLDLKRYAGGGAKGELETGDPLYDVLRWRPNQNMTAMAFWTAMWASEMVWGAGFARKRYNGGKVIALEFLLPQYMTPYQEKTNGPLRFR
jgi:phage portal protein BeeE